MSKPKKFKKREELLAQAKTCRNLGTFFTKYQDELDDRADLLEEEALEIPTAPKTRKGGRK